MRSGRWIAWLILGVGWLIVAGGIAIGYGSRNLVLHGERADAEVFELRLVSRLYAPILRFRLASGEMHEVRDIAKGSPDVLIGDHVPILYRADDPDHFQIDTFDRLWFPALFLSGFGSFWLAFGLVVWALTRRQTGAS